MNIYLLDQSRLDSEPQDGVCNIQKLGADEYNLISAVWLTSPVIWLK
jgi:hypothetical protein